MNEFLPDKDQHYHVKLSRQEIEYIEKWSENFHELHGAPMKVPPRLFETFKAAGGRTKYIIPDKALEQ